MFFFLNLLDCKANCICNMYTKLFMCGHFRSLGKSFLPLDIIIQTPPEKIIGPQNLPKAPSQEVLGCLGFNSNNHSPSRKKSQAQPKSPQEIGHQKLVLMSASNTFRFSSPKGEKNCMSNFKTKKYPFFKVTKSSKHTKKTATIF